MKVLLDTDITSYIFWHRDARVRRRFLGYAVSDVGISVVTAWELLHGAALKPSEQRAVERALGAIVVEPFDLAAARVHADLRIQMQSRGTPIGPFDLMIAAHALSLGVPLVTNNTGEFRRVPGLSVENWLE